jgi:hypothetical protein
MPWRRNDSDLIRSLFTDDAVYYSDPFKEPRRGHEAILAYWEESGDPPDAFDAHYEPLEVHDRFAVAHGRSRYFGEDRSQADKEYGNVFLLWFADDDRCREYREWYMLRPNPTGAGPQS